MATLSRVKVDGTNHIIASSAYGWCTDDANTTNKTATIQDSQSFYLTSGTTVHIFFLNQNTASNPTLNVGGTGAKPIYAYAWDGVNTVKPIWPARSMVSLTYNGSAVTGGAWSMNDTANGRVGTYELAYNTTVDTDELKDAIKSRRQIVVLKSVTGDFTQGYTYGYLSEYGEDVDTGEIVQLSFKVPGTIVLITYDWSASNGWSTSTIRMAQESHASTASTYGLGSSSNYGHVKLSDSTSSTSSAANGVAATPSAVKAVADAKAPIGHASTATTYGKGSDSVYGHLKLSNSHSSTSGTDGGIAATPSAVKDTYDAIPTSDDYYIIPKVFKAIASSGTSTITFTSGTYTRGVVVCTGYGNAVKGMYIVTCTNAGAVGQIAVVSATGAALSTSSYKLTIKNNNTSNALNCDFIAFAGGGTIA